MKRKKIILGLIAFTSITSCTNTRFVDVIAKDKNIYVTKSNGKISQVTFIGKDNSPVISPDKKIAYFIRQTGNFGEYEESGSEQLAIMQVELESMKEAKLTDTIYYADWKSTSKIYEVTGFTLSQDGRFIFFITQKWATSGVLVKLNTRTRELVEISHGDKFELLKDGSNKGNLIVTRSSIKTNVGRQWSNWLISNDGREIKEIGDENAVKTFKLIQQ